jgi:hypothetical protein
MNNGVKSCINVAVLFLHSSNNPKITFFRLVTGTYFKRESLRTAKLTILRHAKVESYFVIVVKI